MAINCALYFGDGDGWVTVTVTVAAAAATSTGSPSSLSKHKQDDSEVVAAQSSENFGGWHEIGLVSAGCGKHFR